MRRERIARGRVGVGAGSGAVVRIVKEGMCGKGWLRVQPVVFMGIIGVATGQRRARILADRVKEGARRVGGVEGGEGGIGASIYRVWPPIILVRVVRPFVLVREVG